MNSQSVLKVANSDLVPGKYEGTESHIGTGYKVTQTLPCGTSGQMYFALMSVFIVLGSTITADQ